MECPGASLGGPGDFFGAHRAVLEGPWRLPGRLPAKQRRRLQRAGAVVEVPPPGLQTLVAWPDRSLRDFMLFDVLMHEVGHHLIQHYKGKRHVRQARTKDHEAFAEHFARRCRLLHGAVAPARP